MKNLEIIYYKIYIYRNKFENKKIWFYGISKYINRIIVRLKVIKYRKDSFYYLFF